MAGIQTVLGRVAPEQLGFTHSHEHLCIEYGESARQNPALLIDDEARTLQELMAFKAAGGGAVADAQPLGCGRNAETLQWLARQSGVYVIASTGFHKMMFYPKGHWIFDCGEVALARFFADELTRGMYLDDDEVVPHTQSGIRAGFIKTALDAGEPDAQYQKLFAAAAKAALQTGAPLMAHIEAGANPEALADLLERYGLPLARVIFCHMDRAVPDLAVHRRLARRGVTLEYDTIARFKYHSDETEIALVRSMLDAGFEGQLLMGLDVTRQRLVSYGGSPGLSYILETFVPLLLQAGVPQSAIDAIFVHNPARAFCMK